MYESESASFKQSFNSSESVPVDDQYAAKSMPHKDFYRPGGVGQQLSPQPKTAGVTRMKQTLDWTEKREEGVLIDPST